jgi:hypothetical protein
MCSCTYVDAGRHAAERGMHATGLVRADRSAHTIPLVSLCVVLDVVGRFE